MKFINISPTTETNIRTMLVFAGLMTAAGFVGSFLAGMSGVYTSIALSSAFTIGLVWYSREIVLWLFGAKEVKPGENPEGFDLTQMVENLRNEPPIQLQTMPKVCVIESEKINAFATGRHRDHAAIAITTGLLKKAKEKANGDMALATKWIEAVWCHELGHVVNRDIVTSSAANIIAASLRLFSENIYNQRRQNEARNRSRENTNDGSADRNNRPGLTRIIAEYLLFYWLVPFVGTLLTMCLSRTREFAADDMARLCGRGKDLAEAFENLLSDHLHDHSPEDSDKSIHAFSSMLCLNLDVAADQKLADDAKKPEQSWLGWTWANYKAYTASHPPIQQRIERLRDNAEQDEAKTAGVSQQACGV